MTCAVTLKFCPHSFYVLTDGSLAGGNRQQDENITVMQCCADLLATQAAYIADSQHGTNSHHINIKAETSK